MILYAMFSPTCLVKGRVNASVLATMMTQSGKMWATIIMCGVGLTHLRFNFLSNSSKSDCCVDVLAIDHMRNVREDSWFTMDESVKDVLLKGLVVVLYTLTFSKG